MSVSQFVLYVLNVDYIKYKDVQ